MADGVGVAQVALGVSKDWRYMNKLLKNQLFSKLKFKGEGYIFWGLKVISRLRVII